MYDSEVPNTAVVALSQLEADKALKFLLNGVDAYELQESVP